MPVPSAITDLSATAASNSPAATDAVFPDLDNFLRAHAAFIRQGDTKASDVASAATTDLGAAAGRIVDVTGTTTITSFGTVAAGVWRIVRFTGALTLTHNGSSLILPGGANITTVAGDTLLAVSLGSGNWLVLDYTRGSDAAVTLAATQTLTNKTLTAPVISTISNSGTVTIPTGASTLATIAGTQTLTNKTISGASNTLSAIANASLTNSTVTIGSTSVALGATAATVAGLTLTTPVIASISNSGTVTVPTGTDTLVNLTGTQTLTNKTLTTPVITSISNSGTVTIPSGADTLANLAGTQTLTNKTVRAADGTASAPTLSFTNDTNTGLYSISGDVLGVTAGGSERARIDGTSLKIGTTSNAGSTSNSVPVVAGMFQSFSGTASVGTGKPGETTLVTLPNVAGGTFLVSAWIDAADVSNYSSHGLVLTQGTGASFTAVKQGALLTLRGSGLGVLCEQNSGVTSTVAWSVTRLA